MFYLFHIMEVDNYGAHLALKGNVTKLGELWRLRAHTSTAACFKSFIGILATLTAFTTLALAATVPIMSFSSSNRYPGAYMAYLLEETFLFTLGVCSVLYQAMRPRLEWRCIDGWETCRLALLPVFLMEYVLLGFTAWDEVAKDGLATVSDGNDTHVLSIFILLYFALMVVNNEFLKLYFAKEEDKEEEKPTAERRPLLAPAPLPPAPAGGMAQPPPGPSLMDRWRQWRTKPPPQPVAVLAPPSAERPKYSF
jgi:hypothetical protein